MNKKVPFLTEFNLHKIIEKAKLNATIDRSEVEHAAKFLHECGLLFHFNDVYTELKELYFLDPEWICCLIEAIISTKHSGLVDNRGVSIVIHYCFGPCIFLYVCNSFLLNH